MIESIFFNTKKAVLSLGFLFVAHLIIAQTTIVLKPDAREGKDAFLYDRLPDGNYGSHVDFAAMAWTHSGTETQVRSLIDFDLSNIPSGAVIDSAKLSLYSYKSTGNGSHSTRSGSNRALLSRVTGAWSEDSVTWNNQPSTTDVNQVALDSSLNVIQDYLNINVTKLIQDMVADPNGNHGFLLKLVTEEYYRSMIFASSDNSDSTLHPKLSITFTKAKESCISLRAGASGKDAFLYERLSNTNYGAHVDFAAMAWTHQGAETQVRSLIGFDLSSIPSNAVIDSAKLSLYSYNSPGNGSHSDRSGSNEAVLRRVTGAWSEDSVTWDNQPTTTDSNQVKLEASTNAIQDYLNINVTKLIQDMVADPNGNHGFLLKLVTEQYYRSLIFASGDNSDSTLHPKLDICYSLVTKAATINSNNEGMNLYPNPTSSSFSIEIAGLDNNVFRIDIINSMGKLVTSKSEVANYSSIDVSHYSNGLYFVRVYFDGTVSTKKLLVK